MHRIMERLGAAGGRKAEDTTGPSTSGKAPGSADAAITVLLGRGGARGPAKAGDTDVIISTRAPGPKAGQAAGPSGAVNPHELAASLLAARNQHQHQQAQGEGARPRPIRPHEQRPQPISAGPSTSAAGGAASSHAPACGNTLQAWALNMSDFDLGRVIGTGSFGRVSLARHKASGAIYVIKSISKASCIKEGHVRHVLDEKALLWRVSAERPHPFLVNLRGGFQDHECLYLVLDFVPGGDFFAFLRDIPRLWAQGGQGPLREGVRMQEMHARFYAAQIILALEHLHGMGVAYRDLKPENLLMDADGYLKLTDFGFAKAVGSHGVTRSFCGTPDYLAPEVMLMKGHGLAVDWWSLGCVVYEMLHGFPPFYGSGDHNETYRKIMAHCSGEALHYPTGITPWAIDIIGGLLQVEPTRRYGAAGAGVSALKAHPWFQGLDWSLVSQKRYMPPYKPALPSTIGSRRWTRENAAHSPTAASPQLGTAGSGSLVSGDTVLSLQGGSPRHHQPQQQPLLNELACCFDNFEALPPWQHPFSLTPADHSLFAEF